MNSSSIGSSPRSVAAIAIPAAFGTYFCMYAFRKPFTASTYATEPTLGGIDYKTALVIAQVLGYMLSKFVGIRFVSEIRPERRVPALLTQIGLAELALILFAITPVPWNIFWLFVNGLMLGTIFGLVMAFLEGRRNTEMLLSFLCVSFIVADGAVKSVGAWLLNLGVPELWMPAAAGMVFVLPLMICARVLQRVPPPSEADVTARAERQPMAAADRRRYLKRYGVGLVLIVIVYLLVTILRSIRADYAAEIWTAMGVVPDAALFSRSEVIVAAGVLVLNGSMIFVKNNRTAFFVSLGMAWIGLVMTVLVVPALQATWVSPFGFMVILGLGLYLPYLAVHTTVFERLIAMTRDRGTVAYLMYLADAFGYLGYVAVLLARQVFGLKSSDGMLPFFLTLCAGTAILGAVLMIPAALYFRRIRSE